MSDLVPAPVDSEDTPAQQKSGGIFREWLRMLRRGRNGDGSIRDTLEELIEEREESDQPINEDERLLLANILELRDRTVHDVMVPRADIVAIELETDLSDIIDVITGEGHSRLPVYGESLDDAMTKSRRSGA